MVNPPIKRIALATAAAFALVFVPFAFWGGLDLTSGAEQAVAPSLSATKTAALDTSAGGDLNGNGIVNPGDRLTYTVTINNGGSLPATGVNFSDTIDANTTEVAGSLIVSPIAVNDAYSSIGNVGITVPAASGLFANDLNPHGSGSFSITAVNTAGTQGTVTVNNADGSFTFNPNPGFKGDTTFSYTLSNGTGLTDNGTVTISVSGMIWFVNNNAPACTTLAAGCGRLSNPFSTLAAFQALNNDAGNNPGADDNVFLYRQVAADYTGPVTLLANQRLVGQGAGSTLASIAGINVPVNFPFSNALPTTGGTNPAITSVSNGINLGSGNTIRGVTVGNTTGAKLNATANVGTLTIGPGSGTSDVTLNGNGQAINLAGGGTLAARFASISTTNSAAGTTGVTLTNFGGSLVSPTTTITNPSGIGISVSGSTAGASFNFGNTTANGSGGTGVSLSGNAGAITFADLDIAPDAGQRALHAINSTGVLTTTSGTFSTSSAVATEITNASGTFPLNVQLTSVSANGGTNGIVLTNTSSTGSPGGFRILGSSSGNCGGIANPSGAATPPDQTDCTGGTIQNTTGADNTTNGTAVYLSNAQGVSLTRLKLNDNQNWAVRGVNVPGVAINNLYITGVNGTNVGSDEGSVSFDNLSGSATIDSSYIEGGAEDNVRVVNTSGTLNRLMLNGVTIGHNGTFGNAGVLVNGFQTAVVNSTVQNSRFTGSRANNVAYIINENASGDVVINGNRLSNNHPNKLGSDFGIYVAHASSGNVTYSVASNSVNDAGGAAIEVDRGAGGSGTMTGTISSNTVGTSGVANSGSNAGSGIFVALVGNGTAATHNATITNNTIRQFTNYGIELLNSGTGSGYLNATVSGNNIAQPSPNSVSAGFPTSGIRGTMGVSSGPPPHDGLSCLNISGNTITSTGTSISAELRLLGRFATRTGLPGLVGSANTFLAGQNTITVAPGGFGAVNATSTNPFQSSCPPSLALSDNSAVDSENVAVMREGERRQVSGFAAAYGEVAPEPEMSAAPAQSSIDLLQSFASFVNSVIGELQPTASAQAEADPLASPESGENVTKPLGTLPPGEQIVVQFKVTIDANIPANDFSVSNTAQITATNHAPVNSTTATTTVVQPPTISKAFGASNIALNGTTSLTFTIGNANPSTAFTNVAFTDNLPPGLVIAMPNGLVNSCGGGTVSATAGASTFSVSALSRPANSSCTIVINVTGTTDGAINNTTTAISSTQGGTGLTSNTAVLNVYSPPSFAKAFGAASIPLNTSTSLTYTITNNSASLPLSNVSFTDNLPAGLVVASPPNGVGMCSGGTITANAGASSISLSGTTLAAGSICTFSVDVTGTTAGNKVNSAALATNELGGGATAMASLNVVAPPAIAKGFSPNTILLNENSVLTISITNPAGNTVALTGAGAVDNLPDGMEVDVTPNATNSCSTGSFSPLAGATSLTISGATVPVAATCTFSVRVRATSIGAKVNTTDNVQSSNGGTGGTATATLNVGNTVTWTGATGTDWNVGTNWNPAVVPAPANSVLIPSTGVTNEPTIPTAGPDITVSGLTVETGRVLTVASGRTLTVNGAVTDSGTINVAGNLAATSVAASGAVNFTGTSAQSIPAGSYNNLTVNNAAGAILAADIDVDGTLALQNGIVNAGDFTLTFSATGSATRGGGCTIAGCFVANGPNAGGVRKQFAAGATAAFVYPVGTSGGTDDGYSPVELANVNAASAGDSLAVRAVDAVSPATISTEKITRYWELTESGDVTADITFRYLAGDDDAVAVPSSLGIFRGGTAACSSLCVDEANLNGTITGVTEFSPWTISVLVPTAADVSITGRVTSDRGKGINRARLTLFDGSGLTRHAYTNSFGYYRFVDVPAGQTYILSVSARRYTFAEPVMVLNVVDDLTDVNFVGSR